MFKNVASQKFIVFAFDATTNQAKTGDAANITAYIAKDNGSVTVLADTSAAERDATNAKGYYDFDAAQTETNADQIMLTGKSSTANVVVLGVPALIDTLILPAFKRGVALPSFPFMMTYDSTNITPHAPAPGKTVTVTRKIDSGAFSAGTLSAVTEDSSTIGLYTVDFAVGDTGGKAVTLRATAPGCDDMEVSIFFEQ